MQQNEKDKELDELALNAKQGDREAVEKILVHSGIKKLIYTIANDRVGSANTDDMYQEVRLSISQNIDTWLGRAKITTWISRVTHNTCTDFLMCQERLKLWQAMGVSLHLEAIVKRAKELLAERRYGEAIEEYNRAMERDPSLSGIQQSLEFFQSANQLPLTAAWSKAKNIMPYLDREADVLAAAKTAVPFPLTVEYADGKVKGKFTTAGPSVFFELIEAHEEFEAGLILIGRILQPAVKLKIWKIEKERKKQRLGTLDALFGSVDFSDIIHAVSTFSVFPVGNYRD